MARIERREKTGADPLNSKDETTAIEFIQVYWKEIVEKWVTFFVYRQAVANTKINKKIGQFIRLHPHPQYNKYLDEAEFEKFTIDDGNIVWGEDWDLVFPVEQLYSGVIA